MAAKPTHVEPAVATYTPSTSAISKVPAPVTGVPLTESSWQLTEPTTGTAWAGLVPAPNTIRANATRNETSLRMIRLFQSAVNLIASKSAKNKIAKW